MSYVFDRESNNNRQMTIERFNLTKANIISAVYFTQQHYHCLNVSVGSDWLLALNSLHDVNLAKGTDLSELFQCHHLQPFIGPYSISTKVYIGWSRD